jgi:hypothetical protein
VGNWADCACWSTENDTTGLSVLPRQHPDTKQRGLRQGVFKRVKRECLICCLGVGFCESVACDVYENPDSLA